MMYSTYWFFFLFLCTVPFRWNGTPLPQTSRCFYRVSHIGLWGEMIEDPHGSVYQVLHNLPPLPHDSLSRSTLRSQARGTIASAGNCTCISVCIHTTVLGFWFTNSVCPLHWYYWPHNCTALLVGNMETEHWKPLLLLCNILFHKLQWIIARGKEREKAMLSNVHVKPATYQERNESCVGNT